MIIFDNPQQCLSFSFDKSFPDFPIGNDKKILHLKLAICHYMKFCRSRKKPIWWTTVDRLRLSAILLNFNIDVEKSPLPICKLSFFEILKASTNWNFLFHSKSLLLGVLSNASSFNNRTWLNLFLHFCCFRTALKVSSNANILQIE